MNRRDYDLRPNRYTRRLQAWHWGVPKVRRIIWDDPTIPAENLIEIGRLCELHVKPVTGRAFILEVPEAGWESCHLAFDPDHSSQRLYILLAAVYRSQLADVFDARQAFPLVSVAQAIGGRHGAKGKPSGQGYPIRRVMPLGTLTHVVYLTHKKGDEGEDDDRSQYIHEMGEEGGIPPALTVDATGRLWIAGGSYTCPTPGITH